MKNLGHPDDWSEADWESYMRWKNWPLTPFEIFVMVMYVIAALIAIYFAFS